MIVLLSLLAAVPTASATTPIPASAGQADVTAATRLAAEAHSRATRALRSASTKADKAELEAIAERTAWLEDHSRKADAAIAEIRGYIARIESIERRLAKVEGHLMGLVGGVGASQRVGPAIDGVYDGECALHLAGEVGILSEDRHTGWVLMVEGMSNSSVQSLGGGAYTALYAKNPWHIKRFALGGYAGGDYVVYGQESQYSAYKATASAGAYARVTIDKPRDGFGAYAVIRPGFYAGQVATEESAAFEAGWTVTATVEFGKFWD